MRGCFTGPVVWGQWTGPRNRPRDAVGRSTRADESDNRHDCLRPQRGPHSFPLSPLFTHPHRRTSSDILAYLDVDCRAPVQWLERIERRFERDPTLVAVT